MLSSTKDSKYLLRAYVCKKRNLLTRIRLLPTNCVRACTASPTEISYNFSEDPNKLYRAEIEFISQDSWIQDLSISIGDLSDAPGGNQASDPTGDSDAAIALRKIQAVYPGIKKEEILSEGTELANRECIRSVFGITQEIYTQKDKELYKQIQKFVDSKEKCRGQPSKVQAIASDSKDNDPDPDAEHTAALENNSAADLEFEYWPLIKVVRIFTKAKVLELGTVLVDLVSLSCRGFLFYTNFAAAWCTRLQRGSCGCGSELYERMRLLMGYIPNHASC